MKAETVLVAGDSFPDEKMHDLESAGGDLELFFHHTATQLQDLVDKCEAEQVCWDFAVCTARSLETLSTLFLVTAELHAC